MAGLDWNAFILRELTGESNHNTCCITVITGEAVIFVLNLLPDHRIHKSIKTLVILRLLKIFIEVYIIRARHICHKIIIDRSHQIKAWILRNKHVSHACLLCKLISFFCNQKLLTVTILFSSNCITDSCTCKDRRYKACQIAQEELCIRSDTKSDFRI